MNIKTSDFNSFSEFYPFYLSQHENRACKILHFIGTTVIFIIIGAMAGTNRWDLFWTLPIGGYFFAWLGHYGFEKNRPATFKHPFYSLAGDFKMYFDILFGKLKL